MCQDERNYPQPDQFIPERFLNLKGGKDELLDPCNLIFGFGRRSVNNHHSCPGNAVIDQNSSS